jgi:hypothetical protein
MNSPNGLGRSSRCDWNLLREALEQVRCRPIKAEGFNIKKFSSNGTEAAPGD